MIGCGVLPDGEVSEQLFKLLSFCHVVVVLQHGDKQTFAKPSRTQQKNRLASIFKQVYPVCPVYVQVILGNDVIKIAITVREFYFLFHNVNGAPFILPEK